MRRSFRFPKRAARSEHRSNRQNALARSVYHRRLICEELEDRRLLSGPPFTGATGAHEMTPYEWNFGIPGVTMWAASGSSISAVNGTIHNSGVLGSLIVGLNGQEIVDSIFCNFTVPSSGWYTVSFAGDVQGTVSSVGVDIVVGKQKGVFQSWTEAYILQNGQPVQGGLNFSNPLYESDLSLTTAIADTTWDVLMTGLKGVKEISDAVRVTTWVTDAARAVNNGYDGFSTSLSTQAQAYLYSGTMYTWELASHSKIGATALGIAGCMAAATVDVQLNSVSIARAGVPTSCNLTASVVPDSNVLSGSPVNISGTLNYSTGNLVTAATVLIDTGDNQYTASVKDGTFSQTITAPSSSRNISVTAYESRYGLSSSTQCYIGIKGNETYIGYQIDDISIIWDKSVTGNHLDSYSSKTAFAVDDPYVETLVDLSNIDRALTIKWEYFKPDGTSFQNVQYYQVPSPQSQGYDTWDWYWASKGWLIAGHTSAFTPGLYNVKVSIDSGSGYRQVAERQFSFLYTFTEHKMAIGVGNSSPYDPVGPRNVFYQTDSKVYTWANLDLVAQATDVRWEWYEPDGVLYSTSTYQIPDPSTQGDIQWDWYRVWGWMDVIGASAISKTGEWHVDVSLYNAATSRYENVYTDCFQILESPDVAPSVILTPSNSSPIETQPVTLSIIATDNTYLDKVTLYWNDGVVHSQTWSSIDASAFAQSFPLGAFSGGKSIQYWAQVWDASGNTAGSNGSLSVGLEQVSCPARPTGEVSVDLFESNDYSSTDAIASLGGLVEYQFDWGDGTLSDWGASTQTHVWDSAGTFLVRAVARSQARPARISDWSESLSVTVLLPGPEIVVECLGQDIANGDTTPSFIDGTNFGTAVHGGSALARTFTIRNTGTEELVLSELPTLPEGYTLVESTVYGPIPAGGSAIATIQLSTAAAGTFTGEISFPTNDLDENPFILWVTGTITEPGPQVVAHTPDGTAQQPVDFVDVMFDEPIDLSSVSAWDMSIVNLENPQISRVGDFGDSFLACEVRGDYAYAATSLGLRILDISTPAAPILVGSYNMSSEVMDVDIVGNLAYVAGNENGLIILDISTPTAPILVGSCDTPGHARNVAVADGLAYVADSGSSLLIFDVSTPSLPTLVGSYDTPSDFVWDVEIIGSMVCVANQHESQTGVLQILDVSSPSAPTLVGSCNTVARPMGIAVADGLAYVAEDSGSLQILDISTPSAPTVVGSYSAVTPKVAWGVEVVGSLAFLADSGGLKILDVSSPASPALIGSYDMTLGRRSNVTIVGGLAYVAGGRDSFNGLDILDVSAPAAPALVGSYASAKLPYDVTVVGDLAFVAEGVDSGNGGLQILDISAPSAPTVVGVWNTPGSAYDVTVVGDRAYVEIGGGFQILDISTPSAPALAGSYSTSSYDCDVAVVGSLAYVAAGSDGLQILDVSMPSTPTLLGSYPTAGSASGVEIVGNLAYVATGYYGLQIIDVSTPSAPALVGYCDLPGYSMKVTVADGIAYMTVDSPQDIRILDVSTPSSPTLIGSCSTASGIPLDLEIVGSLAFVADHSSGLQVLDVSAPSTPVLIGSYDTPGYSFGVEVVGGLVYVADTAGGLQILQIGTPMATVSLLSGTTYRAELADPLQDGRYALLIGPEIASLTGNVMDQNQDGILGNSGKDIYVGQFAVSLESGASVVDMTIARSPTGFNNSATGERIILPESPEWLDEWDACWVEIWVSTPATEGVGVVSAQVDLTYNTDYFTATGIEYGPGFDLLRIGTIDDAAGVVDDLGAGTLRTDVGDDQYTLLARVRFESTVDDPGVPLGADGKYIAPVDNGFGLDNVEVMLVGPIVADVQLGNPPATEIWPVMYDIDDDGRIGFGDFAYFATAFQQDVGDPGATYAWAADFDHSGRIDFGDFAFFASNFQHTKTDGIPLIYHQDFPEAWRPSPLMLEGPSAAPQGSAAMLTEKNLVPIVAEAIHRLETSAGSETRTVLEGVTVEIIDLPGNRLGQSLDNRVWIDVDAAGYGWFIDATPGDDVEFSWHTGINELMATLDSPTRRRVDLLTTVLHELGHVLSYDHADSHGVMHATLPPGIRRLLTDDFDLFAEEAEEDGSWSPRLLNTDVLDEVFASL